MSKEGSLTFQHRYGRLDRSSSSQIVSAALSYRRWRETSRSSPEQKANLEFNVPSRLLENWRGRTGLDKETAIRLYERRLAEIGLTEKRLIRSEIGEEVILKFVNMSGAPIEVTGFMGETLMDGEISCKSIYNRS
jgi:hypothetical protein